MTDLKVIGAQLEPVIARSAEQTEPKRVVTTKRPVVNKQRLHQATELIDDALVSKIETEAKGSKPLVDSHSLSTMWFLVPDNDPVTSVACFNSRQVDLGIQRDLTVKNLECTEKDLKELLEDHSPEKFKKFTKAEWLIAILRTDGNTKLGNLFRDNEIFNWLLDLLNKNAKPEILVVDPPIEKKGSNGKKKSTNPKAKDPNAKKGFGRKSLFDNFGPRIKELLPSGCQEISIRSLRGLIKDRLPEIKNKLGDITVGKLIKALSLSIIDGRSERVKGKKAQS